jgi:poly(3-hydroxybutyrate) depolymerase
MRARSWAAAVFVGVLTFGDGAAAGTFFNRSLPQGPEPGSRERAYQVFVPDRLGEAAAPVVVVLHGCLQSEQNMIRETRFAELAALGACASARCGLDLGRAP